MPRRGGAGGGQGPVKQSPFQHLPDMAKVPQLCREWQSKGRCAHESQCWYCHSQVWQSIPRKALLSLRHARCWGALGLQTVDKVCWSASRDSWKGC